MNEITAQISALSSNLTQRLENLEKRIGTINDEPAGPRVATEGQDMSSTGNTDIHAAFSTTRAALASHRLRTSLIAPTDKPGVRKADQPTQNIKTRVAKNTETVIKLFKVPELTNNPA